MHIIYYVTSHGYGHGVRTVAICNEFSKNVRITFRTTLPEAFFREEVKKDFSYAPASFDCGCIQKDSLSIDIEKTLSTYRTIAASNASLLENESQWCRAQKADAIVSDIVPFAFKRRTPAAFLPRQCPTSPGTTFTKSMYGCFPDINMIWKKSAPSTRRHPCPRSRTGNAHDLF